jgi:hypothetical protein
MTLPTFVIIGAGRSGTTSLNAYLHQHPEVFMCYPKEPNYFALSLPLKLTGPAATFVRQMSATTLEAYEALFAGVTNEKAIGEASPRYLPSDIAPRRIRETIPEVRLVAVLRHPVERSYAAYLGSRRDGFERASTFEEALRACARGERSAPGFTDYTTAGFYHANLTRYYQFFLRERIRVYLYDDLQQDPVALMRDLFGFIGVDQSFQPDMTQRLGRTGTIRDPLLGTLWRTSRPLRDALRPFLANSLRDRVLARIIRDLARPPLAPETRRYLLNLYREDTLRLQDLLGRDLSHWLE